MGETHSNWSSCFTYISAVYCISWSSDRVCSSTDRNQKLCYIRSYSIEINSVKTIICDSVGYLRVW